MATKLMTAAYKLSSSSCTSPSSVMANSVRKLNFATSRFLLWTLVRLTRTAWLMADGFRAVTAYRHSPTSLVKLAGMAAKHTHNNNTNQTIQGGDQ